MQELKRYAVIVAGGSGARMKSETPKQFLIIAGKPVLMHTIERFFQAGEDINLILVLPEQQISKWKKLVSEYQFNCHIQLVAGGETRFKSVKNGLSAIEETEALVAIHDGVRPCISVEIINNSFESANLYGNAIAAVSLKDSIRKIDNDNNHSIDRNNYRLIQTPQTFRLSLIKEAYEVPELSHFTDDASVAENAGASIKLIEGSYQNIKITLPEDIIIATAFLSV